DRKWIYLSYILITALVAWVFHKAIDMVMGFVAYPNFQILEVAPLSAVIAIVVSVVSALIYFRREKVDTFSMEVMQELKKVTWPLPKTSYLSTVVVLVLVLIAALFLAMFDGISNWFVGMILSA